MIAIKFISYILCAYGFCNMIIFANGPFGIFKKWREISNAISPRFGELFTCPICLSTWCGIFFSAIDYWVVSSVQFTPFNIILGNTGMWWLILLMDMGATSGVVWLVHQLEEMMERIGVYYDTDNDNGIEITADIID